MKVITRLWPRSRRNPLHGVGLWDTSAIFPAGQYWVEVFYAGHASSVRDKPAAVRAARIASPPAAGFFTLKTAIGGKETRRGQATGWRG